jgi:hypothetical protein
MSEKGANIDLLFRNGLKDFEVLPPVGVWEGIQNSGKVKTRSYVLLKVAAAVTLLMTLSFFTYRWSRDITDNQNTLAAFDVKMYPPVQVNKIKNNYLPPNLAENLVSSPAVEKESIIVDESLNVSEPDVSSVAAFHYDSKMDMKIALNQPIGGSAPAVIYTPQYNQATTSFGSLNYPQTENIKPENRWSLAAFASPTYYSKFSSGEDGLSKDLMESEEPIVSYTGGLGLSYKISKRFSIQSGLYYSSLGQKLDGINSYEGFRQYDNSKGDNNFIVHSSNGDIYANNPDVFLSTDASERIMTAYTNDVFDPKKANLQYLNNSLTQNLSYLELPLILRYKLVDKTLGINLIGGLSYNFLVSNSVYTELEGNKYLIGDTRGLNPMSVSSSVGMGMEYNVSKKLSLNLEPTFRYYLNPFSISGSYAHPYSFGVFSGVSYKF